MDIYDIYKGRYGISPDICDMALSIEQEIQYRIKEIENIGEYNQLKVLSAMQNNHISERHFAGTTGYGYDDDGRDTIDKLYSDIFETEDALVRTQIVSGTHAITLCLFGILRPGDELIAATGKPYDTLEEVIGIRDNGDNAGSLKDFGVTYKEVALKADGTPDYDAIKNSITEKTKMVILQRSRGYSFRKSMSIDDIGNIASCVKSVRSNIIVMADNCYGEFVGTKEPTQVGCDLVAGSLIKNPGGGLALSGGYIAGKKKLVELCANRLTAPGVGKHVGSSLGHNRAILQGIYFAPHSVAESLKGAVFTAALFERMGYEVSPRYSDERSDIVEAIKLKSPNKLRAFCEAVQACAPIDSYVVPEEWDMPGYDAKVIMAAGTFVQGSSIELSCDGPMKEPYTVYMQGGLTYANVKLSALKAAKLVSESYRP